MSYMQEANAIAAQLRHGRMPSYSGPRKRTTPSPRSLAVLAYMQAFYAENDQLPPMSAIAAAFGWGTDFAANAHVLTLARFGLVEKNAVGKWRFVRPGRAAVAQEADHE